MIRKKLVTAINVLLICAMVIHVGVRMYLHAQNPGNSAPAYVQLVNAVYYLIPLAVINGVNWFLNKKQG